MSATSMQRMIKDKLSELQDEHEWDEDEMSTNESEDEEPKSKAIEQGISMKKDLSTKKKKHNNKRDLVSSTIYIGHLPKYFEEKELYTFLQQFGDIDALRLSRSFKTGHSRGYAFVKFDTKHIEESAKVATIVAETLNGYLLGRKRLVCDVVPTHQMRHLKMLDRRSVNDAKNNRTNNPQKAMRRKMNQIKHSQEVFWNDDHKDKRMKNVVKRNDNKKKELERLGIDYELPDIVHYQNDEMNAESTPKQNKSKKVKSTSEQPSSVDKKNDNVVSVATPKSKKKQKKNKDNIAANVETKNVEIASTDANDKETKQDVNVTNTVETPKSKKKQRKKNKDTIETNTETETNVNITSANDDNKTDENTNTAATPKSDKKQRKKNKDNMDANVETKKDENVTNTATPKSDKKQKRKKSNDATTTDEKDTETFIPSKKYNGTKDGYYFSSTKEMGTGYYLDEKPKITFTINRASPKSERKTKKQNRRKRKSY